MLTTRIKIGNSICGILTLPSFDGNFPGVLLLHGFASDKNEINNIYQYMSEALAKTGVASLRIDFRCWGESAGNIEDSTIDKMIEDAVSAVKYLRQLRNIDAENISIIGFSMGAAIGAITTNQVPIKSLILISPALHLANDFKIFLGDEVIEQLKKAKEPLEVHLPWRTIKLKRDFYLSLLKHDPRKAIRSFSGYINCIAGTNDFTYQNAKEIHQLAKTENKSLNLIDGANHIFSLSNGKNIIQEVADGIILNFLKILSSDNNVILRCRM